MLKRKIYDDLVAWKQRSGGTTALLIDGARRVGKSFIAKEFAENEYKSHIIIDFGNVPKDVLDIFENDSTDLDMFFAKLSVFFGTQLYNRESLIVFDDIRVVCAQAADELLSVSGVDASFVIFKTDDIINISARSMGKVNVQLIMEALGGGGHQTMAAVQLKDITESQIKDMLKTAIDNYYSNL